MMDERLISEISLIEYTSVSPLPVQVSELFEVVLQWVIRAMSASVLIVEGGFAADMLQDCVTKQKTISLRT